MAGGGAVLGSLLQGNRVNVGRAPNQPFGCHFERRSDAAIPIRVSPRGGLPRYARNDSGIWDSVIRPADCFTRLP